jgi:hypothetical protein
MTELVRGQDFAHLFATFRQSAWRWECQADYHEPEETDAFATFAAGDEPDMSFTTQWRENVRRATREGRRFERVRVLTEPMTDYLRFQMWAAYGNAAAGEEIRVLNTAQAEQLDLPGHDFWLLDDSLVAVLHFDSHGMIAAELLREAATVNQHRRWRDIAWSHAAPFEEILTG